MSNLENKNILNDHTAVSDKDWIKARKDLLKKEKKFTSLRDELNQQIRDMPWRRVSKSYEFNSELGTESLGGLFGDKNQLIIVHFMFDPEWEEGCKSCSLMADHYNPSPLHLARRDVSFVVVSRAQPNKLQEFKKRMGWSFKWVSSFASNFNRDFQVTFTPDELKQGEVTYNYRSQKFPVTEGPGISVFYKRQNGEIFHTYSTYARGLDAFIGVYEFLDIVPKGRDEENLTYGMEWVRHHDKYDDKTFLDPYKKALNSGSECCDSEK